MQAPTLVFDHARHELVVVGKFDKRLAELIESQRSQVATSGLPSKPEK